MSFIAAIRGKARVCRRMSKEKQQGYTEMASVYPCCFSFASCCFYEPPTILIRITVKSAGFYSDGQDGICTAGAKGACAARVHRCSLFIGDSYQNEERDLQLQVPFKDGVQNAVHNTCLNLRVQVGTLSLVFDPRSRRSISRKLKSGSLSE